MRLTIKRAGTNLLSEKSKLILQMSSLPIRRVIFLIQQGCRLSEVPVVEGPSPEKLSLVYTMEGSGKVWFILVSSCVIHILRRYSYRRFRENL